MFNSQEMVNYLRINKHDNFNHFQVIMGYLQVGKPDLALSYVKEAIAQLQENATILRLGLPNLVLWLLFKQDELREKGIDLKILNETELKNAPPWEKSLMECFTEVGNLIGKMLLEVSAEERWWEINFTGEKTLEINFTLPALTNGNWEEYLAEKLTDLKKINANYCCSLKEDLFTITIQIN
ncbi:Spo0B domain-containing protein [Bacillota bacterium LX-D]|nr:Spo0B domain-containing protein [Bacillota bacterium LX-D]